MDPSFFGLQRHPFEDNGHADEGGVAETHRSLLTELAAGLKAPHGITLLIGEEGAGKTALARRFIDQVSETCTVAFLPSCGPGLRHLLSEAIEQLGGSPPRGGEEKALLESLRELAKARADHDRPTLVVVDEAHELPAKTIERLGKLFGEDPAEPTMLHILLIGRPELLDRMNAANDRSVLKHLVQVCRMDPIGPEESFRYIADRISKVGGVVDRLFSEDALRTIVQRASGYPGRIDAICSAALEQAAERGEPLVGQEAVDLACMGLEGFSLDASLEENGADTRSYVLGDDDAEGEEDVSGPVEAESTGSGGAAVMMSSLKEFYNARRRLVLWAIGLVAVAVGFAATLTRTGELPAPVPVARKTAAGAPASQKATRAAAAPAKPAPVRVAQAPKLVVRRNPPASQAPAAAAPAVTERPASGPVHAAPLTPAAAATAVPGAAKTGAPSKASGSPTAAVSRPAGGTSAGAPAVSGGPAAQGRTPQPKPTARRPPPPGGVQTGAATPAPSQPQPAKTATTAAKVATATAAGAAAGRPSPVQARPTPPAPTKPTVSAPANAPAQVAKQTEPAETGTPMIKKVEQVDRVRAAALQAGKAAVLQHRYTVQVGAFSNKANADQLLAKLNAKFRDARIVPADVRGKRVYRVMSGSFASKADADGRARILKAGGFSTFVRALTD